MDEQNLRILLNTLNQIAVKGEQNMGYLMGCIKLVKDALVKIEHERGVEKK